MKKFISLLIFSIPLIAQTGLMYKMPDGTIKYLRPTGGVIIDVPRGQIRTAINGGLKATTPNQIWVSNLNGDGQSTLLNMQDFQVLRNQTGAQTISILQHLNPKKYIKMLSVEESVSRKIDLTTSDIGTFNLVFVNGLLYYEGGDYTWIINPPNTNISLQFNREMGMNDIIQVISF